MKFVAGSPVSNAELGRLSQTMVETHCKTARGVVNQLNDDASAIGDFAAHASWVNVSLGVLLLLRADPRWTRS